MWLEDAEKLVNAFVTFKPDYYRTVKENDSFSNNLQENRQKQSRLHSIPKFQNVLGGTPIVM